MKVQIAIKVKFDVAKTIKAFTSLVWAIKQIMLSL